MKKAINKVFTIMAIASIAVSCFACGQIERSEVTSENDNIVSVEYVPGSFEYQQFSTNIVKGNETAVATIEKHLNREVELGEDYPPGPPVTIGKLEGENVNEMLYELPDYTTERVDMIFLFRDDTVAVTATKSEKSFYTENELDQEWKYGNYHNFDNYNSGAFAWRFDDVSYCIASESIGTVTSIWAWNEETERLHLIWCDRVNCPIWTPSW